MKIAYASDLHLEHRLMKPLENDGADLLILAGDITMASTLNNRGTGAMHQWFKDTCANFGSVIYIMGNHEYYDSRFPDAFYQIKERLGYISNLFVLENEGMVFDGKTFWCSTLWTNANNRNPIDMYSIHHGMNDYNWIRGSDKGEKFTVDDMVSYHELSMRNLDRSADVVVTHHCPSQLSIAPQHANSKLNYAYHSNLENFVADSDIKHWICGHTHYSIDYHLGNTQVHMNCRGYPHELGHNNFELAYFDIDDE